MLNFYHPKMCFQFTMLNFCHPKMCFQFTMLNFYHPKMCFQFTMLNFYHPFGCHLEDRTPEHQNCLFLLQFYFHLMFWFLLLRVTTTYQLLQAPLSTLPLASLVCTAVAAAAMEEDVRNSSDNMESLFAGMDFVAPAFSVSVLSTSSSSSSAAAAAAAASPPLSKDPTLSPSLEESVFPQGDLASVAPVLLSPSQQQQQPRLTPSYSIHGFVFQPPGEPLDESLFSGLSLASTTSDVTESQSAEVLEVIASPSPSPPTPPLPPSAIVTSFVEDRTDEVKLERMSSMGSEESGTGDRDVSSVQSIMAAYNDVPPSSRSLPAGIPVGAATLAGFSAILAHSI
jgi:hypothetical protein